MKAIFSSKRHHYVAIVTILLIILTLIVEMAGCAGGDGGGGNGDGGGWSGGGSGTAGDPYQISDWYQLDNVRNYRDSYFILINDIDSTTAGYTELASPTANQGKGWQPIGSTVMVGLDWFTLDEFSGTLDGHGYEIRDLFIDRPDEDGVGLFGAVDVGGGIENVKVFDADISGGQNVGSLVGANYGSISDSYGAGTLSGCMDCFGAIGGLVGWNGGDVTDSYTDGNVNGEMAVGGLVGLNVGYVSNCHTTGSVTGKDLTGGLVGLNSEGGTISNSYATSSVIGENNVGGLVGTNSDGCTISNSYAIGSVTGEYSVGGLVGRNSEGTVSNSYSSASVDGEDGVGGLVGVNDGTVSNSFWDTQTSGQGISDGGTGKTTVQMKDAATFSGATWDIAEVANPSIRNPSYSWNIVDDVTYPFLSWQPV